MPLGDTLHIARLFRSAPVLDGLLARGHLLAVGSLCLLALVQLTLDALSSLRAVYFGASKLLAPLSCPRCPFHMASARGMILGAGTDWGAALEASRCAHGTRSGTAERARTRPVTETTADVGPSAVMALGKGHAAACEERDPEGCG